MTSHAAVVARGWGKTAITGCAALKVKAVSRVRPLLDYSHGVSGGRSRQDDGDRRQDPQDRRLDFPQRQYWRGIFRPFSLTLLRLDLTFVFQVIEGKEGLAPPTISGDLR
jgi:hypothetical protein